MANFSSLPAELQLMVYENMLIPSGPRLVRSTGPNLVVEIQRQTSAVHTALQVNSTSRALALRHINNNRSSLWTVRCLDAAWFNRDMDLVYFDDHSMFQPEGPGMYGTWDTGHDIRAAMVLGGEFPNIMITLHRQTLHCLPPALDHPVDYSLRVLQDWEDREFGLSNFRFFRFHPQSPAQLPRTLYLALGGSWGAFRGHEHPVPQEIITMDEMTAPMLQSLHDEDRFLVKRFLEHMRGWAQRPGLQLPNIFFVRSTEPEIPVEALQPRLNVTRPYGL